MKDNVIGEINPVNSVDVLSELLRSGAKRLIAEAVQAELSDFLEEFKNHRLENGNAQVVRNGYLPERNIQTGLGDVAVKVPRVRDRAGTGIKFNSKLLPRYLRKTRNIEELLPWLYLKGVSTHGFGDALSAILGKGAAGLSSSTISRLKSVWQAEL